MEKWHSTKGLSRTFLLDDPLISQNFLTASPNPYQLLIKCLFWLHAKTHGIALKSDKLDAPNRLEGREPIFNSDNSSTGLA